MPSPVKPPLLQVPAHSPSGRAEISAMESQLRHTLDAIAQKKRSMAAIQQEIDVQVGSCC